MADMTEVIPALTENTTEAIEAGESEVTVSTDHLEALLLDRAELVDEVQRLNEENSNLAEVLEGTTPSHA